MKKKLAISIGDLNGISIELILKTHKKLCKKYIIYYFIHEKLLNQACEILKTKIKKLNLIEFNNQEKTCFKLIKKDKNNIFSFDSKLDFDVNINFDIKPSQIDKESGLYSYLSFQAASNFIKENYANALITLPIHKKAWQLANINYKGHTDALRSFFNQDAIMMLGCEKLFVALFSEHVPLKDVSSLINLKDLSKFLINFYNNTKFKNIGVLAFNPHASDYGTIGGDEEIIIKKAINLANSYINFLHNKKEKFKNIQKKDLLEKLFIDDDLLNDFIKIYDNKDYYIKEPLVADSAFNKKNLKKCNRLVSMYHDLALAPLKALYFEESINISLNLPIIRTSVDHGTAFDIAYKKEKISTKSYLEAVKMAAKFSKKA